MRAATASRRLRELANYLLLTSLTGNSLETAELMENVLQRPPKLLGSFHFFDPQNVKIDYFRLDLLCMVQVTRFQIFFSLMSHRSDL